MYMKLLTAEEREYINKIIRLFNAQYVVIEDVKYVVRKDNNVQR